MDRSEVVAHCLTLPGAIETARQGVHEPVCAVAGRPFAYPHADSVLVRAGGSASDTHDLRQRYPEDIRLVAYEGRNGWVSVSLTGAVPDAEIRALLAGSHHLARTHPTWLES